MLDRPGDITQLNACFGYYFWEVFFALSFVICRASHEGTQDLPWDELFCDDSAELKR